jgi:hypothetical protein
MFSRLIFFMYIYSINMTLILEPTDFCILNENIQKTFTCRKQQCGFDLCSKDYKSCANLNAWYMLIENHTNQIKELIKLDKFLESIKKCKSNQYKSSLKIKVCSMKQVCQYYKLIHFYKPVKLMLNKCICSDKQFKFKCGKYYCSDNKNSCSKASNYLNDPIYSKNINKCH